MSKWGVGVTPAAPPPIRGWRISTVPMQRGWTIQQGATVSYPDPRAGQFRGRVGVCADPTLANMQALSAAGINWLRCDFSWAIIQPVDSAHFTWTTTDAVMTAAAQTGMNVLAIIDYCTPWASSKGDQIGDARFFHPTNNSDYANYAWAIVSRYGPGGAFWSAHPEFVPRPLTAVEIWNEPSAYYYWLPEPDSSDYAAMALAAAKAIKSVGPQVKVIVPADLYESRNDGEGPTLWGRSVFAAQPTLVNYVDAISVHPYPSSVCPDPLDDTRNVDQGFYGKALVARDLVMNQTGRELPVWITEVGWTTATSTSIGVTETNAATYTNHALGRALQANGTTQPYRPAIDMIFFYKYGRSNGVMTDAQGNYMLLRADGTAKPAWPEVLKYV
jgi:hypothetical protein